MLAELETRPESPPSATIESWRKVWRIGFQPQLSTNGLQALRDGLRADDGRILQGATTSPPPMMCVIAWPIEATCAIGYAGWQGDGLETVGQVQAFFNSACIECDMRLNEHAASRFYLTWFDDTPRDKMRRELIDEINLELRRREPNGA